MILFVKDLDDCEYMAINVAEIRTSVKSREFTRMGSNLKITSSSGDVYMMNCIENPKSVIETIYSEGKVTIMGNIMQVNRD